MTEPTTDPDRLFVYGTLRRGFDNPGRDVLEAHADHLGEATTQGTLILVKGLPGLLVRQGEAGRVRGDLYRLTDPQAALETLDRYEGVSGPTPGPYQRQPVAVHLPDQGTCQAWAYVWTGSVQGADEIASGDYLAHVGRPP